eukprot:Clim_evm86s109 gene=Clim_evmTU86s109
MLRAKVLSGIQPTGVIHMGNYFGAVKQWVEYQNKHSGPGQLPLLYMAVDLHAITTPKGTTTLEDDTYSMIASLVASGLSPEKSAIFVQSQVPEHCELMWILACRTPIGRLQRMTQYKDKMKQIPRKQQHEVGTGLLTYPVLMAADILLYRALEVPVGEDQKQHLELTRDTAISFNALFGNGRDILTLPELRLNEAAKIMSLRDPEKKMSKSHEDPKSRITLSDSDDTIRERVMKAVTDMTSEVTYDPDNRPGVSNLLRLHAACTGTSVDELVVDFKGKETVDLKRALVDVMIETIRPIREERERLMKDRQHLLDITTKSSFIAREIATATMRDVKAAVGIIQ